MPAKFPSTPYLYQEDDHPSLPVLRFESPRINAILELTGITERPSEHADRRRNAGVWLSGGQCIIHFHRRPERITGIVQSASFRQAIISSRRRHLHGKIVLHMQVYENFSIPIIGQKRHDNDVHHELVRKAPADRILLAGTLFAHHHRRCRRD